LQKILSFKEFPSFGRETLFVFIRLEYKPLKSKEDGKIYFYEVLPLVAEGFTKRYRHARPSTEKRVYRVCPIRILGRRSRYRQKGVS
jgi:hypothetical protein